MVDFSQARVMMVDTQVRPSDVTHLPIIEAMLTIPRDEFVPASARSVAYAEDHVPIGDDRVLLDPRTLAKMIDAIDPDAGDVVLDLGCGLGYSTAILARMVQAVVGLETDPARAEAAQALLARHDVDNATVIAGGLIDGAARHGPFDSILISGGAVEQVPDALIAQLRDGGSIIAVFIDNNLGTVRRGLVHRGKLAWHDLFHAAAPVLAEFVRPHEFAL